MCLDRTYDGALYGLSTASFSATRLGKNIPSYTTYPTNGKPGTMYARAHAIVNLKDYYVFQMGEYSNRSGVKQIQLLLLHRSDGIDVDVAHTLRLCQFKELSGPNYGGHLPKGKGNSYNASKKWVNLHFIR